MKLLLLLLSVGIATAQSLSRDISEYGPSDEQLAQDPDCPQSVQQCMIAIHTGAIGCLRKTGKGKGPDMKRRMWNMCGPDFQAALTGWKEQSGVWHESMLSCLDGGRPPRDGGRDKRAPGMGGGDPESAKCWADLMQAKDDCLRDMKEACPTLTACMGMGDRIRDRRLRSWNTIIAEQRAATEQAMTNMKAEMGACFAKMGKGKDTKGGRPGKGKPGKGKPGKGKPGKGKPGKGKPGKGKPDRG